MTTTMGPMFGAATRMKPIRIVVMGSISYYCYYWYDALDTRPTSELGYVLRDTPVEVVLVVVVGAATLAGGCGKDCDLCKAY